MKLSAFGLLILVVLGLIACPRPPSDFDLKPCPVPDSLVVATGCYDSSAGLRMHVWPMGMDTSSRVDWSIRILADSLTNYSKGRRVDYYNTTAVYLAPFELRGEAKLLVTVLTTCKDTKAYHRGSKEWVFMKRYKLASGCYQWEETRR